MNQPDIYQQEWCKDLIKRLGRYKEIQSRLEVLVTILDRQGLKVGSAGVARYGGIESPGTGLGSVSNEEWEHREKSYEIRFIGAALNSLTEMDRAIINWRYIEKMNDAHIYDIHLPEKFKKYIGKTMYYDRKAEALKTMGRCLGYDECLRKRTENGLKPDKNRNIG